MALADDFVLSVRQITQYPQQTTVLPTDGFLLQTGGIGGPYKWASVPVMLSTAMTMGGYLNLAPDGPGGVAFNGAAMTFRNGSFDFSEDVHVPSLHSDGDIFVAGEALATQVNVDALFDSILENSVISFNGRQGNVLLETDDVLRAGGAPIIDAHFGGFITAPTPWDIRTNSDQVATTAWVQQLVHQGAVHSFMCRQGDVFLTADDVTFALTQPGVYGMANTPPLGDSSKRIATTAFVEGTVIDLQGDLQVILENYITVTEAALFAPINSPNFTGIPTAPTANPGSNTGQLATTAFVQHAVTASTTGVASFNTRTGAVILNTADVIAAGGAPIASPTFTGVPLTPTAAPGTNNTQIASTAFVEAAVAGGTAGVTSFNTRTGAVVLSLADVTATGVLNSPALLGVPTAPTAAPATNNTQLATTAFVAAALAASPGGVSSFMSRTGAITLLGADVSAAGGALIISPPFTGTPTAPTAAPGTNTTQLATTAFVTAALAATGVTSFNGRSGIVTLTAADITAAGGALLASPVFSGNPTAPTPAPGDNDTSLATTAFVTAAITAAIGGGGVVNTFNTRSGAVVLNAADIAAASGAIYHQSDTPPVGTPQTLWFDSVHGQLYVQYNDPVSHALSWVAANAPQPAAPVVPRKFVNFTTPGAATLNSSDLGGAKYIKVWVIGGGGGGGGGYGSTPFYMGTGGAGGGAACKIYDTSTLTFPVAITVGAAGLGGHYGGANTAGGNGGTTSFGASLSATGGGGGEYGTTNNAAQGLPGVGSGGDLNFSGGAATGYTGASYSQGISPMGGSAGGGWGQPAWFSTPIGPGYGGGGAPTNGAPDTIGNGQTGAVIVEVLG